MKKILAIVLGRDTIAIIGLRRLKLYVKNSAGGGKMVFRNLFDAIFDN